MNGFLGPTMFDNGRVARARFGTCPGKRLQKKERSRHLQLFSRIVCFDHVHVEKDLKRLLQHIAGNPFHRNRPPCFLPNLRHQALYLASMLLEPSSYHRHGLLSSGGLFTIPASEPPPLTEKSVYIFAPQ